MLMNQINIMADVKLNVIMLKKGLCAVDKVFQHNIITPRDS